MLRASFAVTVAGEFAEEQANYNAGSAPNDQCDFHGGGPRLFVDASKAWFTKQVNRGLLNKC